MQTKIFVITQLFDPERTIKGKKFWSSIALNGFKVEVVTTFPSYPFGSLYEGWKQKLYDSNLERNIRVTRLPSFVSRSKSIFSRLLSYVSFSISVFLYLLTRRISKKDVIYVYFPPIFGCLIGILLKKFHGCKLVYDIQDLWPDALIAIDVIKPESYSAKVLSRLQTYFFKKVDLIYTLSHELKRKCHQYAADDNKIQVIHNWDPDIEEYYSFKNRSSNKSKRNIVYAGNLGPAQNIDVIIDAAKSLKLVYADLTLTLIGTGTLHSQIQERLKKESISNVTLLGHLRNVTLFEALNDADVFLLTLVSSPNFEGTIPQKFQTYLSLGRPIISLGSSTVRNLIIGNRCGFASEQDDVVSLVELVRCYMETSRNELNILARNSRDLYDKKYSMDLAIECFLQDLERLTVE